MKVKYKIKNQIQYKVAPHQSGFVVNLPDDKPETFKLVADKLVGLGFQTPPHYNKAITALGGHLVTNRVAWWIADQHRGNDWVEIPYDKFIKARIAIKNMHRENQV